MTGAQWAQRLAAILLVAAACSNGAVAAPQGSDEKLREFMQQVRPQTSGDQSVTAAVPAERLKERADLLMAGEAALARMDAIAAIDFLDRAALILHAADTEIALVRAYMQTGQYRRALAFGAHTAGAHLDVIGGSALYAWLLHAGGQIAVAQRLLVEAEARMPRQPMLSRVQMQLKSGAPLATGGVADLADATGALWLVAAATAVGARSRQRTLDKPRDSGVGAAGAVAALWQVLVAQRPGSTLAWHTAKTLASHRPRVGAP